MHDKVYVFVGEGDAIPNLPKEISEEQARELGLSELLEAAIANGNYVEKAEKAEE